MTARVTLCADGRSPHTYRWANGLAERGFDVTVVWEPDQRTRDGEAAYAAAIRHLSLAAPVHPRDVAAVLRLRAAGRELAPDIVHGLYLRVHAWTAAALGRGPLVLSALGSDVVSLRAPLPRGLRQALVERYARLLSRYALGRAAAVLCDSADLARLIPGRPVHIVRFGVETDHAADDGGWRARLGVADDALVVLSTRLLRPLYNVDVIVRAFATVRRRRPHAVLVLKELEERTDAEYLERCLALARELGVEDGILRVGDLARPELLSLYRAADVFVSVPSTDGLSVSVLEAMAAGLPVVASDAPGIDREIVQDEVTALLARVGDADAVAAAVERVADDAGLRARLTDRAREVVRRHGDFDRELDKAVGIYAELLGR